MPSCFISGNHNPGGHGGHIVIGWTNIFVFPKSCNIIVIISTVICTQCTIQFQERAINQPTVCVQVYMNMNTQQPKVFILFIYYAHTDVPSTVTKMQRLQ